MKQIELLAPGGDIDSIKAAVLAGANAVYCGLDRFNARNRAANITIDSLSGILRFVHSQGAQLFITLNILITESEFPALVNLLNKLVNSSIDAVIVQDLGLFHLIKNRFPSLNVHASTQTTTHNRGQIGFLKKLGATRVNLSRELDFEEIESISKVCQQHEIETEVFVHGSNCISFSGQCFISSVHGGNSGNRGRCSQPCRDRYEQTSTGSTYPLNLKDNCAFSDIDRLVNMGVDSFKIEGRIKKFHYVYTVVEEWNSQLNRIRNNLPISQESERFSQVFNRDFSTAFLTGKLGKEFYSENPMDNSAQNLMESKGFNQIQTAKDEIYAVRTEMIHSIQQKIDSVSVEKGKLCLILSGCEGSPLEIEILTPEKSVKIRSKSNLFHTDSQDKMISEPLLNRTWKTVNNFEYSLEKIDCQFNPNLTIPFSELTTIRKEITTILTESKEIFAPVEFPKPHRTFGKPIESSMTVLVDSKEQIPPTGDYEIAFELPNAIGDRFEEFVELFCSNRSLIPWFPSILIGEDFEQAVTFLDRVRPSKIVTNNSGIAFESYTRNIDWIAGPQFNVINSLALESLKTEFGCVGAYISNELSRSQILPIRKPESFKLFYSIFHPILLMTSRQCLLLNAIDCGKSEMDSSCISSCSRSARITQEKGNTVVLHKEKGSIHTMFNDQNYLNTAIVEDIPDLFDSFGIDLRNRGTSTVCSVDTNEVINLFSRLIRREPDARMILESVFSNVTRDQYTKGI